MGIKAKTFYKIEVKQIKNGNKRWKEVIGNLPAKDALKIKKVEKYGGQPLMENCEYVFRISGRNKAGEGLFTEQIIRTEYKHPEPVFIENICLEDAWKLKWNKCRNVTSYLIRKVNDSRESSTKKFGQKNLDMMETEEYLEIPKNSINLEENHFGNIIKNNDKITITSQRKLNDGRIIKAEASDVFTVNLHEMQKQKYDQFSKEQEKESSN